MKQFGGEKSRLPRLGPLIGAPPKDSGHARGESHSLRRSGPADSVRASTDSSSSCMTAEAWRSLVKVEQTHRIFFTADGNDGDEDNPEVDDSEDNLSEVENLKMPARFWRYKPIGRRVSLQNIILLYLQM